MSAFAARGLCADLFEVVLADDALVLGEAVRGRAGWFVTGDAALLALSDVEGVPILSPRQLWDTLHRGT